MSIINIILKPLSIMKKRTVIVLAAFIALVSFASTVSAQKIIENKKDDFTNVTIKRTSWENLNSGLISLFTGYFSIEQFNDTEFFEFKLMLDKVFSIDEGALISFKLDNGEIVSLPCTKYQITCKGCGATGLKGSEAQGIDVTYELSKENAEKLKANKVVKFRVTTTTGVFDDDIKEKVAEKLQKSLALIN
jgi:hypothetical protein